MTIYPPGSIGFEFGNSLGGAFRPGLCHAGGVLTRQSSGVENKLLATGHGVVVDVVDVAVVRVSHDGVLGIHLTR